MLENEHSIEAGDPRPGDALFEAFVEQVKQVLEHVYDFAYLQQHPLARYYDRDSDLSAKTAGHKLRYDLMKAIESLKPQADSHFRAPVARLYNILHMVYVESLNIQVTAAELGLSERQAYRDLRRGQERVAAALWNNRLPSPARQEDYSFESEIARLKLTFSPADLGELFRQALHAVEKLAQQRDVTFSVTGLDQPMLVSTDAALARQILISLLSQAVQQTGPGALHAAFISDHNNVTLTLRYTVEHEVDVKADFAAVSRLAERLHWNLSHDALAGRGYQVTLFTTAEKATILVIDDNAGWVELLARFLEGYNYLVISAAGDLDVVEQAEELSPSVIILDVMMPERDGWELLQRLRMRPATAQLPILVCTVFNDAQLAYSLGATGFITKPASHEKILEALEQLTIAQ